MIESLQQKERIMDGEGERTAWNRALLAQMGAPPTKAQVLTEIDFEIGDAIQLAAASNFPTLVRPAANGPTRSGPNPAPTRVEGSGRPLDRLEFQAYWTVLPYHGAADKAA
jgi:hypothetical protein